MGIADIWMRSSGSDLRFHIATVLGISMDDWNILAPNSGLFNSRGSLLSEEMWKQMLQLSLVFRRFYTTDENGSQEQGQWIRLLGLPVVGDSNARSSRSSSTIISAKTKKAILTLLEFHPRLAKTGTLRSREFRGMFRAEFLANKKRQEAEFLS